jgi:hypothetical protein
MAKKPCAEALSAQLDAGEVAEEPGRPVEHHAQGQHHELGGGSGVDSMNLHFGHYLRRKKLQAKIFK